MSLDLLFLILRGPQKKLNALIRANSTLIGRQRALSALQDKKVGIGVIFLIDTESRVFVYAFLYRSADRAHFMLNVRQFQQKYLFYDQISRAFRHFKKLGSVRKHQNSEHSMPNAQVLKALLRKQCERARYEDLDILD